MRVPSDQYLRLTFILMMVQRVSYSLLAIILFVYGLIAVRDFLWPIAFGFLLSYLFYPVVNWLEKHKIPRILANFIAIITGLALPAVTVVNQYIVYVMIKFYLLLLIFEYYRDLGALSVLSGFSKDIL